MTQGKAAERVGVSRATFAQWETGRHLPAEERVLELDRLLSGGGELVAAAALARPGHRQRADGESAVATSGAGTRSLPTVFRDARRAFLAQLCTDDTGRAIGWRHNLVPSDDRPSVLSTAYGLKVLAMLGGPDAHTAAVVDNVLAQAMRSDDRLIGWRARVQRAPRMETTATAIDALLRAGVTLSVDDVVRMLRNLVDASVRERPFILTCALEPLLRLAPDAEFTTELIHALLACRVDFGGVRLWPEKRLRRNQPLLDPSLAHTARAVTVLRQAPVQLLGDAVTAAEEWVAAQDNLDGVSEIIRRDLGDDSREELTIHHFTAAWVVRCLAGAAVPDRRRINHALGYVWTRYDPELHLWAWGNGDVPVWMLGDAVAALHDAALALLPTPVPATLDSS